MMANLSDLKSILDSWRQGNKLFACFLVFAAIFSFAVALAIYFPAMFSINYYTGAKMEVLGITSVLISLQYPWGYKTYRLVTREGQSVLFLLGTGFALYWEYMGRPNYPDYIVPSEVTYASIYLVLTLVGFYIVAKKTGLFKSVYESY